MYLIDLLFKLPPNVNVRIKFNDEENTYAFTTGRRSTGKHASELANKKKGSYVVTNIYPLWHAQELYIEARSAL